MNWTAGADADLAWLRETAVRGGATGYDVGPMPDEVWIFNPIYERVDRQDFDRQYSGWSWPSETLPAEYRRVTWREYAQRRSIPVGDPRYDPGIQWLWEIWEDDSVCAPTEGDVDDPAVWNAMFETLVAHSVDGGDTACTAFYNDFGLLDHAPPHAPLTPLVLRGSLGAHHDLLAAGSDDSYYISTPSNVWPDDHAWVLYTDFDGWATKISGPTALIEDLLAHPGLDTARPGDDSLYERGD